MLLLAMSQKYLRELGRHHYHVWIGFVASLGLALGVLLWFVSVMVGGQIMRVVTNMQVPNAIEIVYNDIYAATLKEAIAQRLESLSEDIARHTFKPDSWSKALLDEFSVIEQVTWDARKQDVAFCYVTGVKPHTCINSNLVLGKNGRLYQRFLFSEESLANIACIAMPGANSGTYLTQKVLSFCEKLNKDLLESYYVCYHSAHEIMLISRGEMHCYTIICDERCFSKEKMQMPIQAMINHAKSIVSCGKNQHYFCDVRYKDRAIVSRRAAREFCDETHHQLLISVGGERGGYG